MVLLSTHAQGAIRLRSIPLVVIGGLLLLLVLAVAISALSNIGLPTRSKDPERLSEAEKASLEELFRLRAALGNAVWPSWGDADTGVIVHNESTVFLVGYPGDEPPPPGWVMMPHGEVRGGVWEPVPGETFLGAPIYRQPLPGPDKTPENFTVKVGDAWVATLATREYAEVSFVQGFRQDLPPFLRPIFPYRLMWSAMMGTTEAYVGGLAHESFHAFQGTVVPERLAAAEAVAKLEDNYPWDATRDAWQAELTALHAAAKAAADTTTRDVEVAALARTWLELRAARREGQPEAFTAYEREREWLEGLAKYAELTLPRWAYHAVKDGTYTPLPALADDRDFRGYRTRERFWSAQLSEVQRMGGRSGETRFYYAGFAQGVILDRLMPGWKARAFDGGVWLEGLVGEVLPK